MPRAIWEGSIGFGMAHIPVKLYTAQQDQEVTFKRFHEPTGTFPRQVQLVADGDPVPVDGEEDFQPSREVPVAELSRVYVQGRGESARHVVVTDEHLAAIRPATRRHMQIEKFIPYSDVPAVFLKKTYWLSHTEFGEYAYTLFCKALAQTEMCAVVKVTMRTKEHLAVIHMTRGQLSLSTMYYPDEVVWGNGEYHEVTVVEPTELAMATQIMTNMRGSFDPDDYYDAQRHRTYELVDSLLNNPDNPYTFTEEVPEPPAEDIQTLLHRQLAERAAPSPSSAQVVRDYVLTNTTHVTYEPYEDTVDEEVVDF